MVTGSPSAMKSVVVIRRMCTLIVLHRCVETAPLLVAANRDEYFERPAEGPALRDVPRPDGSGGVTRVVAPRDARAGGTWLGLNEHGLFAALTNRRCAEPDPDRRSRGLIVMDALQAARARDAAERIESLASDAYNPFNLLVADRETAHVFSYTGKPERIDLAPGPHVIGNVHPLDRESPKLRRLRGEVASASSAAANEIPDRLTEVCRSHEGRDAFEQTCVHAEPYGTCSSTLLRVGHEDASLHFADGAPCTNEYEDFSHLLGELGLAPPRPGDNPRMRNIR